MTQITEESFDRHRNIPAGPTLSILQEGAVVVTVCIRYTLDMHKIADFEQYAREWPEPIQRCGGKLIGYYLPTKIAGPTNWAIALIDFPTLAAYEGYREALMKDPQAIANVEFADNSGCIQLEDRVVLRRVS